MRTRALTLFAVVAGLGFVSVAVAFGTVGPSATATSGAAQARAATPSKISALTQASTALPGIPAGVRAPSPSHRPLPGTVHRLGGGKAFGWIRGEEICWNAGAVFGVAACGRSPHEVLDVAIHPIIYPRPANPTEPTHVFGLVVDGVTKVVAVLSDGSSYSAPALENWYDIEIPANVDPRAITEVIATTRGGATYSHAVTWRPTR
jgi:hypothetical protein